MLIIIPIIAVNDLIPFHFHQFVLCQIADFHVDLIRDEFQFLWPFTRVLCHLEGIPLMSEIEILAY